MTYTSPLHVLDTQSSFDLVFGSNPTMLHLFSKKHKQCTTEDTEYLTSKLLNFCNSCQLHIFCDLVQFQYVGTASYDSQTILAYISITLNSITMVLTHRGRYDSLTPDDLYSCFIGFISLLSPNTMIWYFPSSHYF